MSCHERDRPRIVALRVGVDAHAALVPGDTGTVLAAFRNALYVRLHRGVVAVVGGAMDDGPLHLVCRGAQAHDWRALSPPGSTARVTRGGLRLAGVSIDLDQASVWHPPPPPRVVQAARLQAGLAALRAGRVPRGGFAADAYVGRVASSAGERLVGWLHGPAIPPPPGSVGALLGLGPGLTPSGDDYLAGFAVALRQAGAERHLALLAAEITAHAPRLTNEISVAHLAAALRGGLRGDLHAAIDAVSIGAPAALARVLRRFEEEDHHSPWDALAGFADAAGALASRLPGQPCSRRPARTRTGRGS